MLKQTAIHLKKTPVLLALLLLVFFLKGLTFSALLPMFQGFDEPNHFSTAQLFSLSKTSALSPEDERLRQEHDLKYDTSDINFEQVENTLLNTQNFATGVMGTGEEEMIQKTRNQNYNAFPQKYFFAPFARITATLNWILKSQNLLVRFFLLRMVSVLLGVIIVYLAFLIAKSAGFSEKLALLFAGIFAFQPMLTNVTSIINYDVMLVLAFSLFIYSAINLIRSGLNYKFLALSILAVLIGVFTKGTGIILAGLFIIVFLYALQKKYHFSKSKFFGMALIFFVICFILAYFFSPYSLQQLTRFQSQSHFDSIGKSINEYYHETPLEKYSLTYWGNFGWINAPIATSLLHLIWILEFISAVGLVIFFVRKKNPDFLPSKMIMLFLLLVFLALQIGVRFADWRLFDYRGHLILGTSGRYFIPAWIAHLMLIVVGWGAFSKKEEYFNIILKIGFVLMILLYSYSMLSVLIPRYYL